MFMNRNEVTLSIAGSFSGHLHRGAIKNMSLKASKSDDTITSTAPVKVEDMTLADYQVSPAHVTPARMVPAYGVTREIIEKREKPSIEGEDNSDKLFGDKT